MKIVNVKSVGKLPVYDLSVNSDDYDKQQYVLENGVVTHNTGIYYSADNIWILGRRQNKTGTEVTGYDFIINVEKSRFVKEKSKIPISVSWDGGIERFSGLLDIGLASGFVVKPSNGWYQLVDVETGEVLGNKVREKDTSTKEFWDNILDNPKFQEFVEKQYCIGAGGRTIELDLETVNE
jgi:hypothetical protein